MEELVKTVRELNDTNWFDYVQLIATVIGIIISVFALYYAIKVPKRIADEQNRISLFEKRYDAYIELSKLFCGGMIMGFAIFKVVRERKGEKIDFGDLYSRDRLQAQKTLLLRTSFLFNASISKKIEKIIQLRELFFENESLLEEGYNNFSDEDLYAYSEAKIQFYDWEIDTTESLKKISNKYPFKDRLGIDEERDYFAFPLEKQQYEIADELTKLQNEAFDEIVEEMKVCVSG